MQAIILSGGKGTRLYPMTAHTPKPMLHIGGRPHLEHQIELLKKHEITDIIFSTGYLHEEIVEYFGDGSKFGVNIQYKQDGEEALGTAGALKNCADLIQSESVVVLNGDILTNIDLGKLIEVHNDKLHAVITIALTNVVDPSPYGVAVLRGSDDNSIIRFIEKPTDTKYGNKINTGIYVIRKDIVVNFPDNEFYMLEQDVFPKYAGAGLIQGFVDDFYWLDIGTLDRYLQAHADIDNGRIDIPKDQKIDYNFYKIRDDEYTVGTWWGKLGTEITFSSVSHLADTIATYAKKHHVKRVMISPDTSEYSMDFAEIISDKLENVGVEIGDYDGKCPLISITDFFGQAMDSEEGFKYISVISKDTHIINVLKKKTLKK